MSTGPLTSSVRSTGDGRTRRAQVASERLGTAGSASVSTQSRADRCVLVIDAESELVGPIIRFLTRKGESFELWRNHGFGAATGPPHVAAEIGVDNIVFRPTDSPPRPGFGTSFVSSDFGCLAGRQQAGF